MALVIETGVGVAGANSYASVATVTTYATERGLTATGTDAAKESAILRAMAYLEARQWKGRKATRDNALEWPRVDVVDRSGYPVDATAVPGQVVKALCEAALRELAAAGSLQPDQSRDSRLSAVKVGEIALSWEQGANPLPFFTVINDLLCGLVFSGTSARLAWG